MEQQEFQRQLRRTAQEREAACDRPTLPDSPTLLRPRNHGYLHLCQEPRREGKEGNDTCRVGGEKRDGQETDFCI